MPHEASSARGGRGPASRASSTVRGGSANSEPQHSTPSRRLARTDDATQESIKNMTNLISANDWRDRHKGITMLLEMAESNTDVVNMNVVKVQSSDLRMLHLCSFTLSSFIQSLI